MSSSERKFKCLDYNNVIKTDCSFLYNLYTTVTTGFHFGSLVLKMVLIYIGSKKYENKIE